MDSVLSGYNAFRGSQVIRAHEDAQLKKEVCETLCYAIPFDAGRILVKVVDGTVQLSGRVKDRATKAIAHSCVEAIEGVIEVQSLLKVSAKNSWPQAEPIWI